LAELSDEPLLLPQPPAAIRHIVAAAENSKSARRVVRLESENSFNRNLQMSDLLKQKSFCQLMALHGNTLT